MLANAADAGHWHQHKRQRQALVLLQVVSRWLEADQLRRVTSDGRSHMSVFSEVPGTSGSTVGCLAALLLWWMQHRSSAVADSRTSFEGAGVTSLGLALEGAGVTVLAHRCCITFWHCA
jgi:hypothetical protein